MNALKAQFVVTAGVIPGQPVPDYTKVWHYTSEDYEADAALPPMPAGHKIDLNGPLDQPHINRFTRMHIEANNYCHSLINPNSFNWVRLEWMWM